MKRTFFLDYNTKSHLSGATLFLCSLLLIVSSCTRNISDDVVNVWAYDTPLFLQVEADSLSFSARSQTSNEIAVSTEYDYTVTFDCDWLSFEKGEKGFIVTSKENTTLSNRKAVATVSVVGLEKGKLETSFPVSQGVYSLNVSTDSIFFESAGGTSDYITVETEGEYDISTTADWLTVNKVDEKRFTVTVAKNTSHERSDTIIVSLSCLTEGEMENHIVIAQEKCFHGWENGFEWVDLGLPSGTLWATMNVGASSPEDYGDYYAWGETETKSEYSESNYKWLNIVTTTDEDGVKSTTKTFTKYWPEGFSENGYTGIADNKTILDPEDDAATANWGGSWRMPTPEEWSELTNTANCTWTWTSQGGHNGYKVTSKSNGNSLFLPAAGWRRGSNLDYAGESGYYWSSSRHESHPRSNAWYVSFDSSEVDRHPYYRFRGQSVRPVCRP